MALTILGASTINAITDNSNQARALSAVWNVERDAELRKNLWKFSIARKALPALAGSPVSGPYTIQYELPAGALRTLLVGESYPGADMSDYRSGPPTSDYMIEGNLILTNLPAPLAWRGVVVVEDCTQWDAAFSSAFAARLADRCCFRITNSLNGQKMARDDYRQAIREAIRTNALESPPQMPADDTWIAARLGGAGSPTIVNF